MRGISRCNGPHKTEKEQDRHNSDQYAANQFLREEIIEAARKRVPGNWYVKIAQPFEVNP